MTNGDKIRKMTDEELQSLFNEISNKCFFAEMVEVSPVLLVHLIRGKSKCWTAKNIRFLLRGALTLIALIPEQSLLQSG